MAVPNLGKNFSIFLEVLKKAPKKSVRVALTGSRYEPGVSKIQIRNAVHLTTKSDACN